jgi:hypothetical protein
MVSLLRIAVCLIEDAVRWVVLLFRSNEAIQAEILFMRRQLALYIERGVQPRRVDAATRVSLALWAKLFDWRGALVVVQPATMSHLVRCVGNVLAAGVDVRRPHVQADRLQRLALPLACKNR